MPPVSFAPSVEMDIKACAAVREAVGPDIALMLDGYHWYSRAEALKIGRALEKLNFAWFEEMMNEQSIASYAWLATQLDIAIVGPESIAGKHLSRADWVVAGACERCGTPVTKREPVDPPPHTRSAATPPSNTPPAAWG